MTTINQLVDSLMPSPLMPVIFVGHGNPMNAITDNQFANKWEEIGKNLPDAQAIVVVSAHWLTKGTRVTDAPKQPIIYDFYGFPDELYQVEYEAKGSPKLAKTLVEQMLEYETKLDSSWGLDHGTWSVLRRMVPKPEIPILQISIDMTKSLSELIDVYKSLGKLRRKGVIFIGSGNIIHNLRVLDYRENHSYDWALEFDDFSTKAIKNKDISSLTNPRKYTTSSNLVLEMDDHYRPMLASMALLEKDEQLDFFNDQIMHGSLSMKSFITSKSL